MSTQLHPGDITDKEIREVVREALEDGWTARRKPGGHIQLRHPTGGLVHTSTTPSDTRAVRNLRAQLSRSMSNPPTPEEDQHMSLPITQTVVDYLAANPGRKVELAELSEALGLERKQVSNALTYVVREWDEPIARGYGWARYRRSPNGQRTADKPQVDEPVEREPEPVDKAPQTPEPVQPVEQVPEAPPAQPAIPPDIDPLAPPAVATVYELIIAAQDGRVLLRDERGGYWLAARIPG